MNDATKQQGRQRLYISHGAGSGLADPAKATVDWFIVEPREAPGRQLERLKRERSVYRVDVEPYIPKMSRWQRFLRHFHKVFAWPVVLAFIVGSGAAHYLGYSRSAATPAWLTTATYVLLGLVCLVTLRILLSMRQLHKRMDEDIRNRAKEAQ